MMEENDSEKREIQRRLRVEVAYQTKSNIGWYLKGTYVGAEQRE